MARLKSLLAFIVSEFGPLIAFIALSSTLGLKAAIAGSIFVILADAAWRWRTGRSFTRLYRLISVMTLAFGIVDLLSTTPFLLAYEAVITNIVTGLAFVQGARGDKPMIQEVAEQHRGEPFPGGAEMRRFFQIFTLFWAAYFFAKAALYFNLAWTLPMGQAFALRSLIGGVSLGLMIAISTTQGRRAFLLMRRLGWLPAPEILPRRP